MTGLQVKVAHTPGPWKQIEWSCHARTTVVVDFEEGPAVIAECESPSRYADNEAEANACLVAAAPDLLRELKRICAEAESWHSMHHAQNLIACDSICKAIPKMQAAIRKAEGEAA